MVKSGGQFVVLLASCGCLEGQMGRDFKEEQMGILNVRVGALKGGSGGWVVGQGGPARKVGMTSIILFALLVQRRMLHLHARQSSAYSECTGIFQQGASGEGGVHFKSASKVPVSA
eukprot:79988-Pelagomonas_calceolata.AAC.6